MEQKGSYIHESLVKIAKDAISQADFENKKKNFLDIILRDGYAFTPDAPIKTVLNTLNNLGGITTSTAGAKLKRIAKIV